MRKMRWYKVTCSSGVGVVVKGKADLGGRPVPGVVERAAKGLGFKPGTQAKRIGVKGKAEVWTVRRMLAGAPVRESVEVELFESYGDTWRSVAADECEAVSPEKLKKKK